MADIDIDLNLNSDDIPQGVINLYATNENIDDRVSSLIQNGTGLVWTYNDSLNTLTGNVSLSPFSTSNLVEGSRLYWTQTRFDTAISLIAGQANGLATLDATSKIPLSQIPSSLIGAANYQGTWNATTNNPSLSDGTGIKGYYYVVDTAGTQNLGSGAISFGLGDWVIHNGTIWQKVDNTDAVISVNGLIGTVPLIGTSNRITISAGNVFDIGTDVVTLTGAQALSNKTGVISQWTNDSGYTTGSGAAGRLTKYLSSGVIGNSTVFSETDGAADYVTLIHNATIGNATSIRGSGGMVRMDMGNNSNHIFYVTTDNHVGNTGHFYLGENSFFLNSSSGPSYMGMDAIAQTFDISLEVGSGIHTLLLSESSFSINSATQIDVNASGVMNLSASRINIINPLSYSYGSPTGGQVLTYDNGTSYATWADINVGTGTAGVIPVWASGGITFEDSTWEFAGASNATLRPLSGAVNPFIGDSIREVTGAYIKSLRYNTGQVINIIESGTTRISIGANGVMTFPAFTASRAMILNSSRELVTSNTTDTEIGFVSGVTSPLQTQINNLQTGQFWKAACRVATTTAGTLATSFENGDTIDGVVLVTGDRILIKDQASALENGIYVVNASGAPTRSTDFDAGADNLSGATVTIQEGTVNAERKFTCSTNNPITIGVTSITFVDAGGLAYLGTSNRITVTGNVIDIAAAYAGQNTITTLGTVGTGVWAAGEVRPATNDSAALGSSAVSWSDLYLASGAVINFNNGNVGITHNNAGTYILVNPGDLRITSANVGVNADSVPTLSSTSALINKTYNGLTLTSTTGTLTLAAGKTFTVSNTITLTGTDSTSYNLDNVVVGPTSATDNALVRFDNTTGKLIQNSNATLADDGQMVFTCATASVPTLMSMATGATALSGQFVYNPANGSSIREVVQFQRRTSGTPTNNWGGFQAFYLQDSAGNQEPAAYLAWIGINVTDGAEVTEFRMYTRTGGSSPAEALRITGAGDIKLIKAGSGLFVPESGGGATMGTATLVGGTVTINTTKVTANSRIYVTVNGGTLTNVGSNYISARTAGTSFTITSTNILDVSQVAWIIIEPN